MKPRYVSDCVTGFARGAHEPTPQSRLYKLGSRQTVFLASLHARLLIDTTQLPEPPSLYPPPTSHAPPHYTYSTRHTTPGHEHDHAIPHIHIPIFIPILRH